MATEQVTVIEGDGSSDTVTVTDDPAEDSTIQSIVDRLDDVLKAQDNVDEVRVALTADDLPGDLDVSIEDQAGDLAITLDGETVSVDTLPSLPAGPNQIGSVVIDGQPVGVSLDGQTGDLEVTLGTETVSVDALPSVDISSQSAGIATEQTVDAIKAAAIALDNALASVGTDEIRVTSPSPLDASAAEIDVDLNSQSLSAVSVDLASDSLANPIDVDLASASAEPLDVSGATVPTEQQSPVKIEDSGGAAIDPATEGKLENVRSLLDKLDDALTSVGSDEVRVTIENGASPVAFPDTGRRTVSTAGSPESLVSAPAPVASGVEVKAMPGNTGTAFIFISGESKADSYPLAPGDEVFMPVDDASKVIVDVDTGGDTVAFIAA